MQRNGLRAAAACRAWNLLDQPSAWDAAEHYYFGRVVSLEQFDAIVTSDG